MTSRPRPPSDLQVVPSPAEGDPPGATPGRDDDRDPTPWTASPNRLLTVEQSAEFLNLSRSRVYELINAGELPSVTIGRSRRVPLGALDDYVTRLLDGAGRHTQPPG